ncbi:unnamed protein product [Arctia plantaginis]|uniref:E3 ubiquitin-protein ligase n=1 Tax=Arctia plantaginis TaxID=874455 RepID=A0A8S1A9Z0_ARCPL|nr:unnamed protein product [Arctia plantaginis]
MADNKNKNRKNLTSTEKLNLCLKSMNLHSETSGSSSTTKTAYTLALSNKNGNLVLSIETESSKQQHTSHSQTKPITAGPKNPPKTSKPHTNQNTAKNKTPHASKPHPNLSSGAKNPPTTSQTHTNSNNAQKKHHNLNTGQNNKKNTNHPAKANPSLNTGLKKPPPPLKTHTIQKKSFKNTFNPHPKFNTGSKSYQHAFSTPSNWSTGPRDPDVTTHSNWPIGYESSSAASNFKPSFNNFAQSNSPVQLHGSRDQNPRPQYDSDRYQIKEDVSQEQEQRPRQNTNKNEFNCPTCKAPYLPQIYQCASGHSACRRCKENGWSCGICGQVITDIRNFTLEGYLTDKKVPCPHEGCKLFIKMFEVYTHIKECPFGMIKCPACSYYEMPLKQLSGHFVDFHPGDRVISSEVELRYIYEPRQKTYLMQVGAFHFWFHVSVKDRRIYMAVQLIGTKVSASKWFYEIHIYSKNEPHRKYTFSEICTSFVEPVFDLFNECKCCILTQAQAVTFLNNDAINYKVFIKKIVESNPQIELCN